MQSWGAHLFWFDCKVNAQLVIGVSDGVHKWSYWWYSVYVVIGHHGGHWVYTVINHRSVDRFLVNRYRRCTRDNWLPVEPCSCVICLYIYELRWFFSDIDVLH